MANKLAALTERFPVLALRSVWVGAAVALVCALALALNAVLGAPGLLSALVLGLVLPPFASVIGARIAIAARQGEQPIEAGAMIAEATVGTLLPFALATVVLLLNTLRVPVCGLADGMGFLVLGPGISVVLSGALGLWVGALLGTRSKLATTLAFLLPFGFAAVELYGFYATPAIFAYDHVFGFFPGSMYDADLRITPTYATFRVLSFVWLLALWASLACVWAPRRAQLALGRVRERPAMATAAAVLVAVGATGWVFGNELGHRSDAESIAEALGGRLEGERCIAIYPRETPRADARRMVEDCDFRVRRVERVLGVQQRVPVTAFFFRSPQEKQALMGASNTYIAKPWRNEVYLQVNEWPHPVLFHEVVHVVASNVGTGPFRIAGTFGGLLPSPAIIEGTAVAVAWDAREGLTPHQWARAMLEVELAPPLSSVEGLSFLLQPASRAYTSAGSFLRWVMDTEGSDVVRRLYMSGDWESALGRPLEDAEADWHAFLREEVELPEEARALAQQRFERPGLFGQICPHRIANLRGELAQDLAAGDDATAIGTCREILELDPGQTGTRAALVGALARTGEREHADRELSVLVGPPSAAPPAIRAARLTLADALWRRDERAEAERIYRALAEEPMTADQARQLDVRIAALEIGGEGERAIRELLVPARDRTADSAVALSMIARLREVRGDGLADYLDARQLMFRGRFRLALPLIRTARAAGLPSARAETEARRMEAVIRYGAGDVDASQHLWWEILREADSEGERVEARDWLARIRLRDAR